MLRAASDYFWEFFLCGRFDPDNPYTVRSTNYRFDTAFQFDLSELISRPAEDFGNREELYNGIPTLDALCKQSRAREVVVRQVVARDINGNPVYDSVTQPGSGGGGGGGVTRPAGSFSAIYETDVPAPGLQPQPLPPVAALSAFRPYLDARLPIYGPSNAELGLGSASIYATLPGSGFAGSQRVAFRPRANACGFLRVLNGEKFVCLWRGGGGEVR